jgi:hypothetical protein
MVAKVDQVDLEGQVVSILILQLLIQSSNNSANISIKLNANMLKNANDPMHLPKVII